MFDISRALRGVCAVAAAGCLMLAPAAVAAGGSGGGGGGGSTTTSSSTSSCAKITSFSISDRTNWGNGVLITSPYAISSWCPNLLSVDESFVNSATGALEYVTSTVIYPGTTSALGMLSYPGAPFSTKYQVTLSVSDYLSFEQFASQTQSFTTRKPQSTGA